MSQDLQQSPFVFLFNFIETMKQLHYNYFKQFDKTLTIVEFKKEAESLLNKLEILIERLPQKGNTSSECQKLLLLQAVDNTTQCVNGVIEEDLMCINLSGVRN